MALDDVYVLQTTNQGPNGFMMNSYAFIRTTEADPAPADFQALAQACKGIMVTFQVDTINYRTWTARQVRGANVTYPSGTSCTPTGGNLFEGTFTSPTSGGSVGTDPLPWQCSLVVTHKSGSIGRRHRGRTYCFGLNETLQTAGVWTTTVQGQINTAWSTFYAAYAVAAPVSNFRFGIWSVRTATGCGPGPNGKGHVRIDAPNPAQAFTPANTFIVRPTVYTQRRRVTGIGR
jgi:hypothetical protein